MINIVSQPDQWNAAYQPIKYVIQESNVYPGPYTMVLVSSGKYKFTLTPSVIWRFKIGDVLQVLSGLIGAKGVVYALVGNDVFFTCKPPAGFVLTNVYFNQFPFKNQRYVLKVGYRQGNEGYASMPIEDYTECISSPTPGTFNDHSLDIRGFIQDAFNQIHVPKYTGKDLKKYLHFQLFLKVDNIGLYTIGGLKYAVNGCVESLQSTDYVQDGKALIEDVPIIRAGQKFIATRIVADSVISATTT